MKRFLFLLLAAFLLLVPATGVLAQNDWEFSKTFTVTDLQLTFRVPKGWVFDTTNGIALAEQQSDLDVQTDSDPKTIPEGITINFIATTIDKLGLEATATLEDALQTLIDLAGVTVDEQFEFTQPVMGHRVLVITGTLTSGRDTATAVWLQDGRLVVVSLGTPDKDTTFSQANNFGRFIGTFAPLDPLELDAPIELAAVPGYSMSFPTDWTLVTSPDLEVYQYKQDQKASGTIKGISMLITHGSVSDLQTEMKTRKAPTLPELLDYFNGKLALKDPIQRSELKLFDQPALGILAASSRGVYVRTVVGIVDDEVYIMLVAAPDEQAMTDFQPTWIAMLQSIQATAKR
jgi:hypothetical protein